MFKNTIESICNQQIYVKMRIFNNIMIRKSSLFCFTHSKNRIFYILYPESIEGKVLKEKSEQEKNTQCRRPFCPKHLKKEEYRRTIKQTVLSRHQRVSMQKNQLRHIRRGVILYLEYKSVCPFVRIGSPGPLST